ncbi:fibrinogen alpha chain-like [Ambystoma mexicanum]|uniref:fibrinogen alpha chain-like n=1 Tax=Ambystoma mexicanum TaxID=8296 RepID=UPI0037E85A3E
MLRVTALCVLLCLAGSVWSEEKTAFTEEGATGRGPRVVEHGTSSQCKQEKNWGICADSDWGPKCPSGCRIQGLADQADRDFGKRIDVVRKALTDNQNTYKSADQTTKETYNLIKENLVVGNTGEGLYDQVSEDLRRRIANLKIRVVNQLTTIKSLENSIRDQVQTMKRLEVDIDIKIRACKGSCSKGVAYNVDTESYENMQKQLLQAATINLQPTTNELPVLKMRPFKDEVQTIYKALPDQKFANGQYDMFSGIEQRKMVIERQREVIGSPVGTAPFGSGSVSGNKQPYTGAQGKDFEATGSGTKSTTIVNSQGRTVTCTKTITKKTVYGPDGPREEITESMTGGEGDECSKLGSHGAGGSASGTGAEKGFVVTGGGKTSTSTVTTQGRVISCTKTTSKKIVHGPDGPKEEITESYSGGVGDECARLSSMTKGETAGDGGTINVKVTSGNGFSDLRGFPSLDEFFQGSTGSKVHTSSSTSGGGSSFPKDGSSSTSTKVIHSSHDVYTDLGDGETDDFGSFHLGAPSFSSSSSSKTVVSTSGHTKEGSPFEIKSMKSAPVFDDFGPVQHDESGEDTPDLQARSIKKEAATLQEDYTGTDCDDIRQKHTSGAKSGTFRIRPAGSSKALSVYCDQDTTLGGWLLIQQREDGSLNFNRTWAEFKEGFSNLDGNGRGELWLGNEYIHLLTQRETVLRVELEDWAGVEAYAEYTMRVAPEAEGYALEVSHYDGSAGDALIDGSLEDSEYTSHANMKFSTLDRDNDRWEESCAEMYGGGWWYNNCQAANLNGIYYSGGQYDPRNNVPYEIENGVVWSTFKPVDYSLKVVRMKIRPVETQ